MMYNKKMNFLKKIKFIYFISVVIFFTFLFDVSLISAATLTMPKVDIFLKSMKTGYVTTSSTDKDGNFNAMVPETDGDYNMFIGDESMPPVKITAKNGNISGRVVILTNGTTTKDEVLPTKKSTKTGATKTPKNTPTPKPDISLKPTPKPVIKKETKTSPKTTEQSKKDLLSI